MPARRGLSPAAYRRITALALGALAIIIVSGGAVRLTGSGLGCTDWPNCREGQLVADLEYHAMIEFVNRVFTGFVSLAVILAVAGSLRRQPRRPDLTWWSLGLVAGVLGQIVLGAIVVVFELSPWLVIGHFVVSIVLVWNAVVLHHRAGLDADDAGRLRLGQRTMTTAAATLARVWFVLSMAVIATGTVVTGSGPHGGDEEVERLDILFRRAVQIHGSTVMIFVALTLVLAYRLRNEGAAERVQAALQQTLLVLVVQGAIGYVQYFTEVPPLLVAFHLAGATAVWICVVRFMLAWQLPVPEPIPAATQPTALDPAVVRA